MSVGRNAACTQTQAPLEEWKELVTRQQRIDDLFTREARLTTSRSKSSARITSEPM